MMVTVVIVFPNDTKEDRRVSSTRKVSSPSSKKSLAMVTFRHLVALSPTSAGNSKNANVLL